VQDWDDARGAIDWLRLSDMLEDVKRTGIVPAYYSHDHLNEQKQVHLKPATSERWKAKFASIAEKHSSQGEKVIWILLDGFLLYWYPVRTLSTNTCPQYVSYANVLQRIVAMIDVSLFLRVPHHVLRARRHERAGYHTAGW
jgi:nicotinamide/nicotinate riboside kinase